MRFRTGKIRHAALLLAGSLALLAGCRKDPEIRNSSLASSKPISFEVPQGWPEPAYKFEHNPLTQDGFELGRKIFFDPRLSRDNTVSCGSCHQPFSAFAQIDHDVSHGVGNLLGTRNSPAIFNMNWHTSFFWDGGVNHLEIQPLNPITNPVEMDASLTDVLARISADPAYRAQFKAVFGDETVSTQRLFRALAQFMGALVSSNSKYDKYMRGESGGALNGAERNGMLVFRTHCASCHKEPLFSDFSFRNNGLPVGAARDSGRAIITLDPADLYKFKVPSLRNLRFTAPYMHDGSIKTLAGVLDHYASGIVSSPTLDPALQGGIQLTPQERSDLLSFLNTLNDEEFVKDPRFQEPAR
jgi:cytochrome c peroxidase